MAVQLDAKWMSALQQTDSLVDENNWFAKSIKKNRLESRKFLENEIENPKFVYEDFSNKINQKVKRYENLLKKIEAEEKNSIIRDLYCEKIEGQLVRCSMILSTMSGKDKAFYDSSIALHGKPKKKYFAYCALHVKNLCKEPKSSVTTASAKRLMKIFSKIDTSQCDISADILPPVVRDMGGPIKAGEAKLVFLETLKFYGIAGWEVSIDTTGKLSRFSVSVSRKRINIPNNEHLRARLHPLTHIQTVALAEHEIGTHVRRSYAGKESKLALLQYGLKGYLKGEEGVASYMQQQSEGADEFYGIPRYLAASLAVGMDGEPRDFRAVYSVMRDYYIVFSKGKLTGERLNKVVWDLCLRIFRGTTGQKVGTIYTKDIVYLEGNIEVWNLLVAHPEAFEQFFVGKYSPLLKSHVNALTKLDIIPGW